MSKANKSLIAGFISIISIMGIYYLLMILNVDEISVYIGAGVVSIIILGLIRKKMNKVTG